jgi:hypothetical protein
MASQTALVVVDVQDGIANSTYGVPDAGDITHAISSIVRLARLHNETKSSSKGSRSSVEILFIQHDDKDPKDPLYRGKATWELLFPPRHGIETERLVSKDVGVCRPECDVDHRN